METMGYRVPAALLGSVLMAVSISGCTGDAEARLDTSELAFGMPEAEVFTENYDGPPVVGEALTLAPDIAPLPAGNQTHQVRIDVVTQEIEVAPGVRYEAWTFGGSVPGPVLHVREGDRVVFTMANRSGESVTVTEPLPGGGAPFMAAMAERDPQAAEPAEMAMGHSMDFHSGTVAADDKWRTIGPGETIRFEWVANYPGVYLYHCGTPSVLQHMSMGQYGAVVVSPRGGYPTDGDVDREFVIVQSEFYLQGDGNGGHGYDHEAALRKDPMIVAFNGHASRHMDDPLAVSVGDRVRLYVLNVGPNDVSSFHVVGAIFDRVWYEGNVENEWRGMQTVLLGASNGAVMEFIVPEEGDYVMVDHEFADAEKGAKGLLTTRR
jgi:nitrite reductase (NO-forming)